ncbi:phosphonoacetaldehyde hydrolase [Nitrincola sp. MINF-07-Sa-05]|uniref:phosphonoacetaldehyde hydrolase n=1 Tax=Nitrincola salilacus TaxID=3400273 RepID=UPI003917C236
MYKFQRRYTGPIQAVIMDMAGTCMDFGSMAPIRAFQALFADAGVPVTEAEARRPMGMEKRDHILALLAEPRVHQAWLAQYGEVASVTQVDQLYSDFVVHQQRAIAETSDLIQGVTTLLDFCAEQQIGVGLNTGYSREMIEELLPLLAEQGLTPRSLVSASDVPIGRPSPWMCLQNAQDLGVSCVQACIKVDDTAVGIEEGLNAGMWTVAVAVSGNQTGLTLAQWQALTSDEQTRLSAKARQALACSGAHYVIDTVAQLPEVILEINRRLAMEENP